MRIRALAIVIFLLVSGVLLCARQEESVDQLIARADAAAPKQQADLYIQVADRELKSTLASYKANQIDAARASLAQVVKYADKGHSAAIKSDKKLKHAEIKIRQISDHLRDLKFDLDPDDQPLVQAAVDKLESFRTDLLHSMFGANSHD
jgi:exonuclease VII small subunit